MIIIKKVVPDDFNLFLISCTHFGAMACHEDGIDKFIDMMESDLYGLNSSSNFCLHHGDLVEGITIDDKRFDLLSTKDPIPGSQLDYAKGKFRSIKNKFIACLYGNHEKKLFKFNNLIQNEFCRDLNIPYGTYSCIVEYVNENGMTLFKHYATHGRKGISSCADDEERRQSNMRLILKRQLKEKTGDCLLMSKGHAHKIIIANPVEKLYIKSENGKTKSDYTRSDQTNGFIHPDHRWFVCAGSFLKTYGDGWSNYAEEAEYDPVELGFVVALIRNGVITGITKIILD
jgi:hypothetical protein